MVVGEQPGDWEDRRGRPFVGPAGRVLDRGLELAGIQPADVYTTNVVKHFKWERRGARRVHRTPTRLDVAACRPWLAAELDALKPKVVVLLGATVAQAVFGPGVRRTAERGLVRQGLAGIETVVTAHPAAILHAAASEREDLMAAFVRDLRLAAKLT
jgi:DNA polymerase